MAYSIPTAVPASLRAGDTATWRRLLTDYPAPDGWTLSYALVKAGQQILIPASADGDAYLVEVADASTAAWTAGTYAYQERVSQSGKSYTVSTGSIEILASFAAAAGGLDARSHAQKTLAALEAWIENHDPAVAEYDIAGRKMKYISIPDLLTLRDQYRREVRGQAGKSGRVYTRF